MPREKSVCLKGLKISTEKALSLSCAVIAPHIGSIPEIVTDKNQGSLVNLQQRVSLTDALRTCITVRSRGTTNETTGHGFGI
jgi:hypothetical protein